MAMNAACSKILIADDNRPNVELLEAYLTGIECTIEVARDGQETIDKVASFRPDVILLDVMMPSMDGFEVCRRLKDNPATQDIPVIMVTALDQTSDKLQGLDCGADDFLTKPVDDIALITRVKNLARLKTLNDEMNMRASTNSQFGLGERSSMEAAIQQAQGRILLVEDQPRSAERLYHALAPAHAPEIENDLNVSLFNLKENDFDLVIVSLSLREADGLRLCSQIRSLERIRHLPIIILVEPGDEARLLRGLDMGVNDYLMRPVDQNELLARVKTQIKRKRYSDFLRNRIEQSVEFAITDALTGLHNRRYMEAHLQGLVDNALATGRPLSLLVADIDHFKRINDTYGHDVGDVVLREFAERFRQNTRGVDLVCRLGGEEFLLVMPDVDMSVAYPIAERLRMQIAERAFFVSPELSVPITASVGLSTIESETDSPEVLFKRADNALYAAKREGRNRVVADAA